MYTFHWLPGSLVQPDLQDQFCVLYSSHYGKWGGRGYRPGENVSISRRYLSEWLTADSHVVWVSFFDQVVGYAIALRTPLKGFGTIAWVTQLVVHEDHRRQDIAKRLLFSIWKFTDHVAWGVLSANPYAIRALEKATRRRCSPKRIKIDVNQLMRVGRKQVTYIKGETKVHVTDEHSVIDTKFFLDHTTLPQMLGEVTSRENPWTLGPLAEGWEWFAFTFKDQEQFSLSEEELAEMLAASDQVTQEAFARMRIDENRHGWASHTAEEIDVVVASCCPDPHSQVLDLGCGTGRHSIELAKRGYQVTAIDYISPFVEAAKAKALAARLSKQIEFRIDDCRFLSLRQEFSCAICLYDVIGTYVEDLDNRRILKTIWTHLRPGGRALISVMNLELTMRIATQRFALSQNPDELLTLPASSTMETTGDIFNPAYFLLDTETDVIYRKEQFKEGDHLPEEMIVRDRRYTPSQITSMCQEEGFSVLWYRRVRSGDWNTDQAEDSPRAKEILLLCEKRRDARQHALSFDTSQG
jgi:2-polyprenyl-3-methyl-5-hydroxy-6-metoxy-1,4-benzoquinol methylase/GNAT superfamily N-acetyltransferase